MNSRIKGSKSKQTTWLHVNMISFSGADNHCCCLVTSGTSPAEEASKVSWASRQVAPTSESQDVWFIPDGVRRAVHSSELQRKQEEDERQ